MGIFSRQSASGKNRRLAPKKPKPARESGKSLANRFNWGRIRLWGVGVMFTILWGVLWARAFQLQIIQGPELAERARRQHVTTETVTGVRGNILDRNGNIMARSIECESVWINARAIGDKEKAAAELAEILKRPISKILPVLKSDKSFIWLARKVDYQTAEAVRQAKLPGVYLQTEYERIYPYMHRAGQLLGFVNIDGQGLEGLELAFEDSLKGHSMKQLVERDASGKRLVAFSEVGDIGSGMESLANLGGQDLRLTIDAQVQFFAEEALAESVDKFEAAWGGCIVVDVPTGEVLAWAQYPFFNPNAPNKYSMATRRNRLAMDALEQGSTIKSFVIAAALEEQVITPETKINCEKGKWKVRNKIIHDTHSYDVLPVGKIIHVSSNIGAAKIGFKLGAQKYHTYLSKLGFGQRTELPLAGEAKGILRNHKKWQEIDLATSSFGQSFSTTLTQMAQAYLCIAGDGTLRSLKLVMNEGEDSTAAKPERVFSEATVKEIRTMLREVVEEDGGTGKQARISGLMVGGKTGTAQKADKTGRYGRGRVGSFVGMIPIEQPRYLVCVLLDEPKKSQYGGVIAAPVFRHVALQTMAYNGHLPDSDDPLLKAVAASKANDQAAQEKALKADSTNLADALKDLKKASDRGQPKGKKQTPEKLETAEVSADVVPSDSSSAEVVAGNGVPNVIGLGMRSAVEAFARQGIVPTVKGSRGVVIRQSPEPGTAWPHTGSDAEQPVEPLKFVLWLEDTAS